MLAETDAISVGTFVLTIVTGALAALCTFAAVIGQWYTMSRRVASMERTLADLTRAVKGEGEATGLAGKAREHDLKMRQHSKELAKIWDRIEPGRGGSAGRRALSDSGD